MSTTTTQSPGKVPVLQLTGTGSPVRVSPLQGSLGQLTLEAWVNPNAPSHQQAVMQLVTNYGQLLLTAGGAHGDLSLVFVSGSTPFTLCTAPNVFAKGV